MSSQPPDGTSDADTPSTAPAPPRPPASPPGGAEQDDAAGETGAVPETSAEAAAESQAGEQQAGEQQAASTGPTGEVDGEVAAAGAPSASTTATASGTPLTAAEPGTSGTVTDESALSGISPGHRRFAELLGFGDERTHGLVVALRVLMILFIPVGGLVIVTALVVASGFRFGLLGVVSAIALLPVPFLFAWFIWLDRFDPPRWEYLAFAFGWGACVSTSASLVVNTLGGLVIREFGFPDWWTAVLVAPVVEEITKGLAPLLLFLLWRREVIGIPDAVMYAGLSATGFAMMENVLYLGGVAITGEQAQGQFGAVVGVVSLVVVRLGFTGFLHPLFTVMTGIGIGMAARAREVWQMIAFPVAGLVLAVLLHGTWNYTATLGQKDARFIGYLYFLVALPLLFGFVVFGLWIRSGPGRTIRAVLPEYVRAGWFSPPEVGALLTPRRRLWARRWAQHVAGQDGLKAMKAYQAASTRLALLRQARRRGVWDWGRDDLERRLLDEVTSARKVFTGRDGRVPDAWWDGQRYLVTFPDGERREVKAPRSYVMPVPIKPMWGMRSPYPAGVSAPAGYPGAPYPGASPGQPGTGHPGAPYPGSSYPYGNPPGR